jgi:Cys-rich repeat protein
MPNGYCAFVGGRNTAGPSANFCVYSCLTDADCDAGKVCQCGSGAGAGVCGSNVPSCKSDADCAGGALCTNYDSAPGCMIETFACQTPADKCESDSDCLTPLNASVCTLSGTRRECAPISCAF